jgi:hypothetical protein
LRGGAYWLLISAAILTISTSAALAQAYSWRTAEIGGGGFVSGTIFHPTEPGLVYARTDVGGTYRLDTATNRWIALNDEVGGLNNEFQHLGVLSIALDPSDPDRVYLASGQYGGVESWKLPSRIYRSTNRGATWTYVTPGFKMAGNGEGRGTGERMAVDPANGANLLIGTSNAGIWRSTDYGATWTQMTNFTPTECNFVLYRPRPAGATGPTPVYASARTLTGPSLWRSDDNGTTWAAVANQPGRTVGAEMMAVQGSFDAAGVFYSTWGDETGPTNYQTYHEVWKLSADGATWTQIQPPGGGGGFSGISADPRVPGHVVAATLHRYSPGDEVYRSTDGGATWTAALRTGTRSVGNSPWTGSGVSPHWITDIDIDPFDSDRAIFNTGYGLYQTKNLGTSGTARTWTFFNDGLEELVTFGIHSPTAGTPLVSVVGDYSGFRSDDLARSPLRGRYSPNNGSNSRITSAALAPTKMIRQRSNETHYSTDAGATWATFPTAPAAVSNGHGIAIFSADGQRILWCPTNSAAYVSTNAGASWAIAAGTSLGVSLTPIADQVDSQLFHLWNDSANSLLKSTDGGQNFTVAATGLNSAFSSISSVPGQTGHLWASAGDSGLYRSTNFGATFTKNTPVGSAYHVTTGRAAPAASYPALFIFGKIGGVAGLYRSDDTGASWTRINDDLHQFGGINAISGDPRAHGRIYLGTSGRGVVIGDFASPTPPAPQPSQAIYTDALQNGWSNASPGDTSLTSTSPIHGGTSAISIPAGSGKSLALSTAARSLQGYAALSFWVNAGASAPPPLQVGGSRGGIPLEAVPIPVAAFAGWQQIVVPFVEIGLADVEDLTGLRIESRTVGGVPPVAFSIDDVMLLGSGNLAGITLGNLTATADGTPKAAIATTTPGGLTVSITYDGSTTAPTLAGSYSVVATISDPVYQGSTTGTLVIAQPALAPTGLTGWASNNAGTTPGAAGTSSPLHNPTGVVGGAQNTLHTFFSPITLTQPGDKITLTGSVTLSAAGVTGATNWFRFGLFDNRGQAPTVFTGWLGYTGMGNSLWERLGLGANNGLFTTGFDAVSRTPDAGSTGTTAPSGTPPLAFEETITRTATGIIVTHRITRTDTAAVLMDYTYTDTSPNNNGTADGTQDNTASTGYNPTYRAAGFAFASAYVGSSTASAQFSNIQVSFTPGGTAQTITFPALADRTFGDPPVALSATATSGLPVAFHILAGPATISGNTLTITGAGTVFVRATQSGDATYDAAVPVDRSFTVAPISASVSLSGLSATYDGSAKSATATTTPSGLTTAITYNGSATAPTAAGSYAVVATVTTPNYAGSASGTLVIAPADAQPTLSGLAATADGTPKSVTVTTIPPGVAVSVTYDGSPTAPTFAGSYAVAATVTDPNYTGSANGTLVITQAAASFGVTGWTPGTAGRSVSGGETNSPLLNPSSSNQGANSLLQAYFNPITLVNPGDKITLTGSMTLSEAGTSGAQQWFRYGLFDNRGQPTTTYTGWLGYTGMATNTMANALMERTGGSVDYASTNTAGGAWRTPNASPTASGTTSPSVAPTLEFRQTILRTATGVDVTFHLQRVGASVPALTLTYSDTSPNNNGTSNGTQNNTASGYSPTYRAVGFLMPTTYISASNDAQAQFTGIQVDFVPANTPQTITFDPLPDRTFGDAPFMLTASASSGLPVTFSVVSGPATIAGSQVTITGAGSVTIRAAQAGDTTYLPATLDRTFTVAKAAATVTLSDLTATYDGTQKPATATTSPAGLNVGITYNGSSTAPSAAGSYAVVATIAEANYQGTASGTLVIYSKQEAWRFLHFGTYANTGTAADTYDANADGESNLLEFATDQNPHAATLTQPALLKNGPTLELTYTRAHAALADGVTFTVEWSDTLAAGSWSNVGVSEQVLGDNGSVQTVRASIPAGADRRFIHLKVSIP